MKFVFRDDIHIDVEHFFNNGWRAHDIDSLCDFLPPDVAGCMAFLLLMMEHHVLCSFESEVSSNGKIV